MTCPACGAETLAVPLAAEIRTYLPEEPPAVALCTRCLTVSPLDEAPAAVPDLQRVSEAFPRDDDAGVALVAVLALLDRLALYRAELNDLLDRIERMGVDPLLTLDRLAAEPDLDPAVDLDRRRTQLEQLLR